MKILIAIGVVLCSAGLALAQASDVVVVHPSELIDAITPYLVSAASAVVTACGTVITVWLKQKWNIDADTQNRDALEMAISNTAAALIAKGAATIEASGKVSIHQGLLATAVKDIVENRAPDAIAHFAVTPQMVSDRINAGIIQFASAVPAPAPPQTSTQRL